VAAGLVVVAVFAVSRWRSVCRDFGDGCAGGGSVDDGFVGGKRGDEGLQRQVVDRAGVARLVWWMNPRASSEMSTPRSPSLVISKMIA
jgi:hypothetical protein